jgi:serine/threonine protein phosphatase PrpC
MPVLGEIERVLKSTLPDITEAARRLVVMANEGGGRDNISVVLVRVHPSVAPDEQ